MRIIQLTPGTGNFYCGACLRDRAMTLALGRLGHEVQIIPMYLPLVLEDGPIDGPVLFGGVNVYLQQKIRLFRHTPRWMDRMLDHPALLNWASGRTAGTSAHELGAITISMLRGELGHQRKELDKLTKVLDKMPRPDVICLSNVLLAGLARQLKERLGAAVVCTLQGEDGFLDALPPPYRQQAWETLVGRVSDIDGFVAVSTYYGDVMTKRLHLAPDRVHIVHNGIELDGFAPADTTPDPPVLGYLARLSPVKGLEMLVDSFIAIRQRGKVPGLKLHLVGTMTSSDKPFVTRMVSKLQRSGVGGDLTVSPNVDRQTKFRMLRSFSVLSVPATYGESFGLYVLEALASGVPVVQPRHGSFAELLQATGGGILCEPNDVAALTVALESLLLDDDERRRLGQQGRRKVIDKFGIDRSARRLAEVISLYEKWSSGQVNKEDVNPNSTT